MSVRGDSFGGSHAELAYLYALQALPESEQREAEAHIAQCAECRRELEALRPVIGSLVAWPTNVLRPPEPLWDRLAERLRSEAGVEPEAEPPQRWREPQWRQAAPGIWCKLLASDPVSHRVTMLVRLQPGIAYPPHSHAGLEELHLLEGELWIEDRKLYPGDYNRGEPGTADKRVWSETGCTCVLITSARDVLG